MRDSSSSTVFLVQHWLEFVLTGLTLRVVQPMYLIASYSAYLPIISRPLPASFSKLSPTRPVPFYFFTHRSLETHFPNFLFDRHRENPSSRSLSSPLLSQLSGGGGLGCLGFGLGGV